MILDLIPQRPPFVLLDDFVSEGEEEGFGLFTVPQSHVLVENGLLTEGGLVENIAQTAAARAGHQAQKEGKPVPLGYIGSVQDLKVHTLPEAGTQLKTTIRVVRQIFQVTQVTGTVYQENRVIAECQLKIFLDI